MADPERELSAYKFPVHDRESLFFAASGVHVERAEIRINNMLMSTAQIGKGEPMAGPPPTQKNPTEIDLFGGNPFHRGLLQCDVEITIYTYDNEIPTLMLRYAEPSITWSDIDCKIGELPEYNCKVSVGVVKDGVHTIREMNLVYFQLFAAYRA